MRALLDKILAWTRSPAPPTVFGAGPIARGLAHFKSIGCPNRNKCPHGQELFGCADCTQKGNDSVQPRPR